MIGVIRITRVALVALLAGGVSACGRMQARTPADDVLNIPAPPLRVLIPVELVEPEPSVPPTTPSAVLVPPARQREAPARPSERTPPATPPAAAAATPPPQDTGTAAPTTVLQTTTDTGAMEQQTVSVLAAAQRDLDRVRYTDLGADARAQYDRAKGFIQMAKTALGIKNFLYAKQLADKAAAVANLLAKS
jgi:hypothetical protein